MITLLSLTIFTLLAILVVTHNHIRLLKARCKQLSDNYDDMLDDWHKESSRIDDELDSLNGQLDAFKSMPPSDDMLANIKNIANSYVGWGIISALRGPDTEKSGDVKNATTCVIRSALGLSNKSLLIADDTPESVEIRKGMDLNSHFADHAKLAFDALGLKWNELNPPPAPPAPAEPKAPATAS